MKLTVLCCNDFPIGVYTSQEKAQDAITEHKQLPNHSGIFMHYHTHDFQLNGSTI